MCPGTGLLPPMSSVLGRVLVPNERMCASSVDGTLSAAVRFTGGVFVPGNKRNKEVDTNHFHVTLAHARSGVLKVTAHHHDSSGGWTGYVL